MTVSKWYTILICWTALVSTSDAVVKRPAIVPRFSGAEIGEWTMDHTAALEQAQAGTNNVVVMFNGAWWCPHCQALENAVFTKPEWQAYVETNRLYLVTMDFPGRTDNNWCWLRETNYLESVGLTLAQGEAEITSRYAIQTAYATPGAAVNPFGGYLRVGYPTLIVLRPDGSRLGRFTPLVTTVSMEMVLRNINQILGADAADETDNYYQGATVLPLPPCEDEEVAAGTNTLSETDAADWYAFDAEAGIQWAFAFREAQREAISAVKAQIFENPTNTLSLTERVLTPSDNSVLSYIAPKAGRYWLKVSRTENLTGRVGYHLVYWCGTPPATAAFASPEVSVSEGAPSVSLTVNITEAANDAEVHICYETVEESAQPAEDYVPTTGDLIWTAGVKGPKTVTIPLLSDNHWEGDETFLVKLYVVKNCEVSPQLSTCTVVLREQTARQPGKLGFEGVGPALLVEGSNATFTVARSAGADGVVSARVDHVEGTLRTPVAQLVWTNRQTAANAFSFVFTNEAGFQADRNSSLKLVPLGGASLVSTASGSAPLTRRDALFVRSLAEFAAEPESRAFGLKATRGLWLCGACSEAESPDAWLRSGPVKANDSATLTSSLQGPGVLEFDGRLEGEGGALRCLVNGQVAAVVTNSGVAEGMALAVPAGRQTVAWTIRRGAEAGGGEVFAAVRHLRWVALPQAVTPLPLDKAAVIHRALTLTWSDVLDTALFPAGVTSRYELYAGGSERGLAKFAELPEPGFPRAGNAEEQAALDALIAKVASRPIYWRVDTVATDPLGRRAVFIGKTWSSAVLPEGSPEFVADIGGYDPGVPGGISIPEMTVGVYGEAGPFKVANTAEGTVRVLVKNGSLPNGLSAVVRDGAIWIVGAPRAAGAGASDLHLSLARTVGRSTLTSPGSSLTVAWTVRSLGRASGSFDGYLVTDSGPGCGNASVGVTGTGNISGRFVSGGLTYTFAAGAFGGRTNAAYFVRAVAKTARITLPVTLTVAEDGSGADLQIDGAETEGYGLRRNNWKDSDRAQLLSAYVGYYTVALPVLEKSSPNAPGGTGYLTLMVKANGTVTFAGQMADDKRVSGSAVLLYGPDCCSAEDRVTFYLLGKPSGYGTACGVSGVIYLAPGDNGRSDLNTVTAADPQGLLWVNADPQSVYGYDPSTGELPDHVSGFTNVLDVTGGFYGSAVNLAAYYGDTTLMIGSVFAAPSDFDGQQGESGYGLTSVPDPLRLPAVASGYASLAFPRSVFVRSGALVDFAASVNPWLMTVRPNRATGIYSGSCRLYYQKSDGAGRTYQKSKDVFLKGVFLPVRAEYQAYADWMGFYLMPDAYRYDASGKQQSYRFNWSYDFSLLPMQ